MRHEDEINYAGFWVRLLAFFIDGFLISSFFKLFNKFIDIDVWFYLLIWFVISWGYYAYLVYRFGATPGKMILGLKIVNNDLNPTDLKRASIRYIASLLTFLIMVFTFRYQMFLFEDSIILFLLGTILASIPIMMLLFNSKKQVLHDYLAKTIVVDLTKMATIDKNINTTNQNIDTASRISPAIKIVSTIGVALTIITAAIFLFQFGSLAFVYGTLYNHHKNAYNNSFHLNYQTNDYNDSKILFYKHELEVHKAKFIEAESMYDIFVEDVKSDMAQDCIEVFLQDHNESKWLDLGYNFSKNARNKYTTTDEKIQKAKKNEDYMGQHFYDYDLNDVRGIEEDIIDAFDNRKNSNQACRTLTSTDEMFDHFIVSYAKNREDALNSYKRDIKHAPKSGTPNKNFYKREIKTTQKWLATIYEHQPHLINLKNKRDEEDRIKERKRAKKEKIRRQKELEKENREKAERKAYLNSIYQRELNNSNSPIFAMIRCHKDTELKNLLDKKIDINVFDNNGYTPIFIAISQKNIFAIKELVKHGAKLDTLGVHGLYTPLSWATPDEDMVKLLLELGADINYQENKSETVLTVTAKGCKNFKLVEFLMSKGANPNLKDRYKDTTKTSIPHHCLNQDEQKKMIDLIERKDTIYNKIVSFF